MPDAYGYGQDSLVGLRGADLYEAYRTFVLGKSPVYYGVKKWIDGMKRWRFIKLP